MKISYAIPVHNEYEEIDRLLEHLLKYKLGTTLFTKCITWQNVHLVHTSSVL